MKYHDARILVFTKAPVLGEVKTRLVPLLGERGALELHQELAARTITTCLASKLAPVQIWATEPHAFFDSFNSIGGNDEHGIASDARVTTRTQQGDDLGLRMEFALSCALQEPGVQRAVLAGTDCPPIDAIYLDRALAALEDHDVVLGPTEDGGYGLIGLRHADPELFSGITWSTDTVCVETCRRLDKIGLRWSLLPLIWDVDRPEDIPRFRNFQ